MQGEIPAKDYNGIRPFNSGEEKIIRSSPLASIVGEMEKIEKKKEGIDVDEMRLQTENQSIHGIIDDDQEKRNQKIQKIEEKITERENELETVVAQRKFIDSRSNPEDNPSSTQKMNAPRKRGKLSMISMGIGMIIIDLFVIGILHALYRETMSEEQLMYRVFAIVGISVFLLAIEWNYRKTEEASQRILLAIASAIYLSAVLTILILSVVYPSPEVSLDDEWSLTQEVLTNEITDEPNTFADTYRKYAGFLEFAGVLILFIISRFLALKPAKPEEEVVKEVPVIEEMTPIKKVLLQKEKTLKEDIGSLNEEKNRLLKASLTNAKRCFSEIKNVEEQIKKYHQVKEESCIELKNLKTQYHQALNDLRNDLMLYKAVYEEFMAISSPVVLAPIQEEDIINLLNLNRL